MVTKLDVYDSLIDRRGTAFRVTYIVSETGEESWVPVFADDEDEARQIFENLTGDGMEGGRQVEIKAVSKVD